MIRLDKMSASLEQRVSWSFAIDMKNFADLKSSSVVVKHHSNVTITVSRQSYMLFWHDEIGASN
jgi:hypothetical protein